MRVSTTKTKKHNKITLLILELTFNQSPLAHPLQPQWTHSITFSSLSCFGTLHTQVVAKLWSRGCMHLKQQRRS